MHSAGWALLLLAVSGAASAAEVYRCQTPAGKVEFRDTPCEAAHKAQKLDVQPNSAGTMTPEQLRAKTAESKAKRLARQDAEDRAAAADFEAGRRAYVEERAHQDALDVQQAVKDGPAPPPGAYWDGFSRQPPKVKVEVTIKPTTPAKPPPPK